MGTELALHLLDHDLTVWNRTPEKAQRLIDAGARFGKDTSNADVVITSLFGPDTVRKILPDIGDALWIDTTTVSPTDAATPVVGTLGPARAGNSESTSADHAQPKQQASYGLGPTPNA